MNTFEEIRSEIQRLIDSDITSYRVRQDTGLSGTILDRLRKPKTHKDHSTIDNLTFKVAEQLYSYTKKNLPK